MYAHDLRNTYYKISPTGAQDLQSTYILYMSKYLKQGDNAQMF
jgi:hypothetical protein